jgi:hypothetical protein
MKRLLFACALLAGCPDEGTLGRVSPIAVLTPPPGTPLVFEEVVLGKNKAEPRIVNTANEGDADLIVSAYLESEGPIRVSSVNKRVIPGDDGEVFLRFEPAVHGTTENVLVVMTNDPKVPEARYPVTGPARERCKLSAWPPYQRFRLHETREVSIFNDSLTDCEITRFFMEDEKLFKVLDAPAIPAVIPALGEMKLHVEHPRRTELAGPPVRQLHLKEKDGTELIVSFEGALPLWDCLGVYPRKLEFPDTDLGVFDRQSAIVYSSCEEPAIVRSAHVGIGYYYFDVDQRQFPVIVPPFGEAEVKVDYFPFSEFGDAGRLSINTDDALNRQLRLELEGKALIPELLTIPRIDFGDVAANCGERIERVPLLAIGEARTIIKSLSIAGDPAFTVAGVTIDGVPLDDPTPPFTVPKGSSGHVLVRFAPAELDPEERQARLVVGHNGREQSRQIALVGRPKPAGGTTEEFIAPSSATVDVLFVIDDSRSMEREQDNLQAAMSAFMGRVQAMGAPARFAVLAGEDGSNAPGWPYRCPPHPYVIEPSYSEALSALTCAVRVGYSSETPRAAIGSAIRGLARAIDPAASPNPLPDFLRPDAELAVLFVSDEDDHSLASDLAFRDFLYSIKGSYRPERARVHAIAGDPTTDCTLDPWLIPGVRYRYLARETGGTFADACTEDFAPLLTQLADTIFAPRHRFDLSRAADPASIAVLVAGAPIALDPVDGYTFDANSNSIELHGAARPIAGDAVSIAYGDACR